MICILELACFVGGIIILVFGRIPLGTDREVRGGPAYFAGGLLVATLPLSFGFGFVVGYLEAMQGGPILLEKTEIAIEFCIVFGFALTALVVALVNAEPKRRKKRRRIVDDGYDDFDRRGRKRWDEIEDEEKSRRLNPDDEPHRQRRSYDDDDYDRRRRHY